MIYIYFLFRSTNLPNGGNTMGNEPNGICGIVADDDGTWAVKLKAGGIVDEEGGGEPDEDGGAIPAGGTCAKTQSNH
jgi:hypothetical protein